MAIQARNLLINSGWQIRKTIMELNDKPSSCPNDDQRCRLPEAISCSPTGDAPCRFKWLHPSGTVLWIYTLESQYKNTWINHWKLQNREFFESDDELLKTTPLTRRMFYREARQLLERSGWQVIKTNSPTLNRCKDIDRAGCNYPEVDSCQPIYNPAILCTFLWRHPNGRLFEVIAVENNPPDDLEVTNWRFKPEFVPY